MFIPTTGRRWASGGYLNQHEMEILTDWQECWILLSRTGNTRSESGFWIYPEPLFCCSGENLPASYVFPTIDAKLDHFKGLIALGWIEQLTSRRMRT